MRKTIQARWTRGVRLWALLLLGACAGCGKPPVRGTPEWDARLADGDVVVESRTVPGTDLKLVLASGLLDAPVEVVWEFFKNADYWSQVLYQVRNSRELAVEKNNRRFKFVIEPPIEAKAAGFNDIEFIAEITESISPDRSVWRGDFIALEGNVRNVYGAWQLEPYGAGKTLIIFSAFLDFGYPAILNGVVNFYSRQFLEHWARDLRTRLADRQARLQLEQGAAVRAGRDPREVAPVIKGVDDFMR